MIDHLNPHVVPLVGSDVRLYLVELSGEHDELLGVLAADASEGRRARAARFRSSADAVRCLAAEALLRHALRCAYGLEAETLTVAVDGLGKPFLANHPRVHFSLSHSGAWVGCALCDGPVGLDIEDGRRIDDLPTAPFMSLVEWDRYRNLPANARPGAFYRLWTLKESVLKAAGTGMSFDPRRITVSVSPAGVELDGAPEAIRGLSWHVRVVPMPAGIYAAVCEARSTTARAPR